MAKTEALPNPAQVNTGRGRRKQTGEDKAVANFRDELIVESMLHSRSDGNFIKNLVAKVAKKAGITSSERISTMYAEFRGYYNGMVADYQKRIEMRKIRKVDDVRQHLLQYITPEDLEAFGAEEFEAEEEETEKSQKRA